MKDQDCSTSTSNYPQQLMMKLSYMCAKPHKNLKMQKYFRMQFYQTSHIFCKEYYRAKV